MSCNIVHQSFNPVSKILYQEILKTAFENGINMFDVAESYGDGQCEIDM